MMAFSPVTPRVSLFLPTMFIIALLSSAAEAAPPEAKPDPPGATPSAAAEAGPEAEPSKDDPDGEPTDPEPAPEPEADPEPQPDPQPEPEPEAQPDPEISTLLESEEPEETQQRVAVAPVDRSGVDRSERLRSYYARIYRPPENPDRIYFAARAAYSLAGTSEGVGGGQAGFFNAEVGQTWNFIGYGVGATLLAGNLTFGDNGVENHSPVIVGGGPSLGIGRLGLFGRGYLDVRAGYNFFYAPVATTRAEFSDPPDASPHGPKIQVDVGLLFHDSEQRRFRHGIGASVGWQMLVHSFTGEFPRVNTFNIGVGYFFG